MIKLQFDVRGYLKNRFCSHYELRILSARIKLSSVHQFVAHSSYTHLVISTRHDNDVTQLLPSVGQVPRIESR